MDVFEGLEFDKVYFAENVPLAFIETMRFRTGAGRRLQVIYDFTPKWGFTPALRDIIKGMVVVRAAKAPLLPQNVVHAKGCPPGQMPLVMECRSRSACAVFTHTGSNPMGQGDQIQAELRGADSDLIMIRGYGYARRTIASAFPAFGAEHIISRAAFERIKARGGTIYFSTDGCGSRNWFMKWYFVTPAGHKIIFREWPNYEKYDEWALTPTKGIDWRRGPAQYAEFGRGVLGYKKLILGLEGAVWDEARGEWDMAAAEKVWHERFLDPRFAKSAVPGQEDGANIIDLFEEEQRDDRDRLVGPAMSFKAAACGRDIEDTIQMINNQLEWADSKPLTPLNCPKWYVVEDMHHTILAMKEWSPAASEKCALKDIVDCDRYLIKENPEYLPAGSFDTLLLSGKDTSDEGSPD